MRTLDIIRRSGRSLRQAKARTFLTASAIGVGAFALTMTLAASNGAQAYVNKIITDNFDPSELIVANDPSVLGQASGNSTLQRYDASYTSGSSTVNGINRQVKDLTDQDLAKIGSLPGVAQVDQAISPSIQYITGPNGTRYVANAYTFNSAQKPDVLAGSIPTNLGDHQLLLPQAFVSSLGFKSNQAAVGQVINLAVQKGFNLATIQAALAQTSSVSNLTNQAQATNQNFAFTIAAVYKNPLAIQQPGTSNLLYISLPAAINLNDYATQGTPNYHKYSYAYVKVTDGTNQAKLTAVQNKLKALGYQAQSVKDTQKFLTQIINVLRGIVIAFGLIALIASVFGIVNTMYISVLQRTREIGLMKALGMRRREIGSLFRIEAAWIGFLGGVLGSAAAVVLGTLINPAITKKLDLDGSKLLIFKPLQIIVLIIILMLVAIIAGLLPARKAAKLDPIEALRVE